MRKLVLFMHVSLDGFVAGPNGEMDWIHVDEEIFDLAGQQTDEADTALYGRVTYQMMDSYWPTAGDQPNASKHDIQHSNWYNKVPKVVISRTMKDAKPLHTSIISEDVCNEVRRLKELAGNNILMFGSPTTAHTLMHENLIDEYWLFINPVVLGKGIPLFANVSERIKLKLESSKAFGTGVVCLQYTTTLER